MQQPGLAQSSALAAAGARGEASGDGVGGEETFGLDQQAVVRFDTITEVDNK